jgi:hypothetical protein
MLAHAGAIPGPAPEAVEREVHPRVALAPFAAPTHCQIELREPDPGIRQPVPVPYAEEQLPLAPAAVPRPEPEAVEREVRPSMAAALPAATQNPVFQVLTEAVSGTRVPATAALCRTPEAVERQARPWIAAALPALAQNPGFQPATEADAGTRRRAALPAAANWLPAHGAQAAERELATREFAIPIAARTVRIPELRIGVTGPGLSNSGALTAAPGACDDQTRRIAPAAASAPRSPFLAPAALGAMPALRENPSRYPSAGALRRRTGVEPAARETAPRQAQIPGAAAPLIPGLQLAPEASRLQVVGALGTSLEPEASGARQVRSDDAAPRPVSLPQLGSGEPWGLSLIEHEGAMQPDAPQDEEPQTYPAAGFLLLEYHPQRMRGPRIADLAWK